jgi:D-glycero-alpha-D-manno-heptose 1-phosphate guanylyltransferase
MKVIILAGGLGTRLGKVTETIPKPMVEVVGKPFLQYLLDYLVKYDIEAICLAVGFKYDVIQRHFGDNYHGMPLWYSIEKEPLGTGGALKAACKLISDENFLVLNGDTYFDVELNAMWDWHIQNNLEITMAVKYLNDCGRYGKVVVNEKNRITGFEEKTQKGVGLINGGIYALNKCIFHNDTLPKRFSFEEDILKRNIMGISSYAYESEGYFIDIGVPEDLEKARLDFSLDA